MNLRRRAPPPFDSQPHGGIRPNWWQLRVGSVVVRVLLGAASLGALTWAFPTIRTLEFSDLKEGMIADLEIITPFDFHVEKRPEALAWERENRRGEILPVVRYDPSLVERKLVALDSLLMAVSHLNGSDLADSLRVLALKAQEPQLLRATAKFLLDLERQKTRSRRARQPLDRFVADVQGLLVEAYTQGVIADRGAVAVETPGPVTVLSPGQSTQTIPLEQLQDLDDVITGLPVKARVRLGMGEGEASASLLTTVNLTGAFLEPNYTYDPVDTERRRKAAEDKVPIYKRLILKDERVVDANEKITPEVMDALSSLSKEKREREFGESAWRERLFTLGRVAVVAAVVSVFVIFLILFRPAIAGHGPHLFLFALVIVVPACLTPFMADHFSKFLVPIALTSILVTVLFDAEVGIAATLTLALLVGSLVGFDFQLTFVAFISGAVAAFTVRRVRVRQQFYLAIFLVPLAYGVAITATDLLRVVPWQETLRSAAYGALGGFLCPILAMGFLPIFESIFNITTDITLLELSDLNRPLLRDLAVRAPGTYSHSVMVANLAETAAEKIGANPLLVRVGAYYHDIGKMAKPEYFVENQQGAPNPHDRLAPSMSVLIITSHVREGIEIAREHGLPRSIIDMIPQHHGTQVIEPFYNKAVENQESEGTVRESDFRYPGPRPQTKEAGILMLADGVESASRTIREPTPGRLQDLIQRIIQGRYAAHEFDECDLTLKDLAGIGEAFLPVLVGHLHGRTEYPWQTLERHHRRERVGVDVS